MQPEWSAFRTPTYGFVHLNLKSADVAEWCGMQQRALGHARSHTRTHTCAWFSPLIDPPPSVCRMYSGRTGQSSPPRWSNSAYALPTALPVSPYRLSLPPQGICGPVQGEAIALFYRSTACLAPFLQPPSPSSFACPLLLQGVCGGHSRGNRTPHCSPPSSALHSYQPLLHSSPALSPLLSPRSAGSLWWPLLGAQDTFSLTPSSALHSYQPTSPSVPSCPLCHREFVVATPGGRQKLDKISFQRRPESCSNSR